MRKILELANAFICADDWGPWKTSPDEVVVGGERIELPTNGV